MANNNYNIEGLTDKEVAEARAKFGHNALDYKKENGFIDAIKSLVKEPMVVLLLAASIIYFVSGKTGDGIFLSCAIVLVATISLYQDSRSRNALEKLKNFSEPHSKVIRNGELIEIKSEELVVGDYLMVEEGSSIPADGIIVRSNDFSVNESVLTGESFSVYKDASKEDPNIFRGTTVASGLAIAKISATGNETKLGKIGKSLESIEEEKTPLEKQIFNFVMKMVILGAVVFAIVWLINYLHSKDVLDSLLKALTLAMSILPEEIPVALATFMALGAWRLMQMGIIVKQTKTVETLGSATVICTDKTGTLTENKMSLAKVFVISENKITKLEEGISSAEKELIKIAMWASEPIPFDPMELALHESYLNTDTEDERPSYHMIHEYPLSGKPPMMTHLFENETGNRIIAAKGAPEAILKVSKLTTIEIDAIQKAIESLTNEGFRVLCVADTVYTGDDFPVTQQEFEFSFKGVLAFYDPPKKNIGEVLNHFYDAGINVKIVTGDNAATTASIAEQVGFRGFEKTITGDELMQLSDEALQLKVKETQIFTRMFPEAKLRIINALKSNNEIVAMTGDGVNDGPALKAAHIGIAMGKKGTEIAKQAASHIISIHIPIVLTVFLPLALGWIYPNIFSPVHIIFLELIMGPTCSIIYENEPMEKNTMKQTPRALSNTFFNWKELTTSIIQGLMITVGTMVAYQYAVQQLWDEATTRTMVFTVLIAANILLTLVNRSFYYSLFTTMQYKNNLVLVIILITIAITGILIFVPPLTSFFGFAQLTINQILISMVIGFSSVIWYELIKWRKRLVRTRK
jgi:Ca2+-transporting ATPase